MRSAPYDHLVILRCTRKLLAVMGLPVAEPAPAPDPEDWYANLLWFDRRKCLLLTHSATFGDVEQPEVLLAKTADRSVLGCINDMAFMCEHAIAGAGGLTRTDLAGLNQSLRRNINSARGYRPPIELAALHRVPDVTFRPHS